MICRKCQRRWDELDGARRRFVATWSRSDVSKDKLSEARTRIQLAQKRLKDTLSQHYQGDHVTL